jgi:hypothetical protein
VISQVMSAFQAFLVHLLILEQPLLSGYAFLLQFVVRSVRISGRQVQLFRKYRTTPGHLRGRLRSSSWVGPARSRTELNAVLSRTVGSRQRVLTCSATFTYGDAETHCVRFLDTSQWKVSRFTVMVFLMFAGTERDALCSCTGHCLDFA